MAASVTGGKPLPHEVADQIVSKTDGVPLFVEELTKSIIESGLLTEQEDHFSLPGSLVDVPIPETLRDALEARLDRLASVRDIAQIGATIGRTFGHELLRLVSPLDEVELQNALARLVESGLIFRRGELPNTTYTFKHALVLDTAYGSLLRSRRAELHEHIAVTLERQFPDRADSEPEVLAHHFTEARSAEKGAEYWLKAAETAMHRSAMKEGVAHIEKGLVVVSDIPAAAARDDLEVRLHLARAELLRRSRGAGLPEVGNSYTTAYQICRRSEQPQHIIPALVGMFTSLTMRGDLSAYEYTEDLVHLSAGDRYRRFVAHQVIGESLWYKGDNKLALSHLEDAVANYDPTPWSPISNEGAISASELYMGLTHLALGFPERAMRHAGQAALVGRGLKHSNAIAFGLVCESTLLVFIRNCELILALSRTRFPWTQNWLNRSAQGGPEHDR